MDNINFNSVETLPNLSARAAFQVNLSAVLKEAIDIVSDIIDDTLSYISSPPKKQKWLARNSQVAIFLRGI